MNFRVVRTLDKWRRVVMWDAPGGELPVAEFVHRKDGWEVSYLYQKGFMEYAQVDEMNKFVEGPLAILKITERLTR